MNLKSAAGATLYVKNLAKSIKFYEDLGLVAKKNESNHFTLYLNWYWLDLVEIRNEDKPEFLKEAKAENKGAGIYLYFSADSVDDSYEELVAKGYKPSSEPKDWPWGNREFVIRDPDGYKIVIFKRK